MKTIEEAAKEYISEFGDDSFIAGAEFAINRMSEQERKQELFNFLQNECGYTALDGQMNDIINILTKD